MQENFRDHVEKNEKRDPENYRDGKVDQYEDVENNTESKTSREQNDEENRTRMEEEKTIDCKEAQADGESIEASAEERKKTEEGNEEGHEAIQEDQICQAAEEALLNKENLNVSESPNGSERAQHFCYDMQGECNHTEDKPHCDSTTGKKRTGIGIGLLIPLCAIVLVFALIGGTVGYFGGRWLDEQYDLSSKLDSVLASEMSVIKNDGSISVNEQVGSSGYENLTVPEVVALVADSVVEITTTQVTTDRFYGNYVTSGAGSGVIVDSNGEGYIITNHHVIDEADEIVVRLTNGKEYKATCLGSDADCDIAVLKIDAEGLTFAVMGSSSNLKVGQGVVAIGNPLGSLGGTVTDGIISALGRNLIVDGHAMTLLQTNAAINPGNSGGGLFDMGGNLIGIVNAKQADTGIEGLGFAIPIDIAWAAAKDIIQYGYVTGKLDLGFDIEVHEDSFSVQQGFYSYTFASGVYVVSSKNSNLAAYDRIVSINGKEINDIVDYYNAVLRLKDGDTVTLVVSRLSGGGFGASFKSYTVTLEAKFTSAPNT